MCGIVGISYQNQLVDLDSFELMVDSLQNRGPDGRGVQVLDEGQLCLGHTRLSIIDLSAAGNQPMPNEDQSVWLTFNGEIYNYVSLRRELERYGHIFRSHSDSETIIHAFEEWGTNCVYQLKGIFAFAIYDCKNKSLFLARDHVGVKPLYYYHDKNTFMFSSQPRAIIASNGFSKQIDQSTFSLFLAYGNTPSDSCIYKGIKKLLPGHYLTYNGRMLNIQKYWSANYQPIVHDLREAEHAVRSKIEECVRTQTISDVQIGSLLSGGVDSTIITSIITKHLNNVTSYTVGFDERDSDEREYARYIADIYHTKHYEILLTYADACKKIPQIIEASDEPFHLNGLFPFYTLSQLVASSGGKVVLGGDGADELFAGYLWYESFKASQSTYFLKPIMLKVFSFLGLDSRISNSSPVETFFYYNGYLNHECQKSILAKDICLSPSELLHPLTKHWRADLPPVLAGQLLDFNCFLVDHCLTKVDRSSMACGVEARVPFLDVELVDLVFSIDHKITYFSDERKALLKQAMSSHLPLGMNKSRKKGFSSPLSIWLSSGIRTAGEELLCRGYLCEYGMLNSDKLRSIYSQLTSGQQLLLIGAELWMRRWIAEDVDSIRDFSNRCLILYG